MSEVSRSVRKAAPLPEWAGLALEPQLRLERVRVSGRDLSGQDATNGVFDGVRFENVRLPDTTFRQAELIDAIIQASDASNSRFERALLRRVRVSGSRLLGLTAPECLLEEVVFQDCDLTLCRLRFAKLKAVRFEDCKLAEADFTGSELSGAVFKHCDLRGADFSQATAPGMDIRGSQIEGIHLTPDQMRGGSVDFDQALYLLRLFGLNIGGLDGD